MATHERERRSALIQFRITPEDKNLIARAALEQGIDMSAFITHHAKRAAQQTRAEQVVRRLDPASYAQLERLLRAPATSLADLAALAAESSPFADR